MGWPGEQLLGKMWDTLTEKGIGTVLKPGQIKREGLASIEIERLRIIATAQAEVDAREIKEGRKQLSDFAQQLDLRKPHDTANISRRIEPTVDYQRLREASEERLINDTVRKELNVASAIVHAEETLRTERGEVPNDTVEEDWLYRWRDHAGEVSSEELQKIWGKLLAGEVKAPGTYSLRTLEFLKNLSRSEAQLIERVSSFAFNGIIWRPREGGYKLPLSFTELMDLQELGILSGIDAMGLEFSLEDPEISVPTYIRALVCNDKCLIIRHQTKASILKLPVVAVTKLGLQILTLGSFRADLEYLRALGRSLMLEGYKVSMGDRLNNDPKFIQWVNEQEITPE